MPDRSASLTPNPVAAVLIETMGDRHADMAALLAGMPDGALDWTPTDGANSLADLARHILEIEGHVARELEGGDPAWTGASGTQAEAPADAGGLAERLETLGRTLEGLLNQVSVAELPRLTVALEEFDHCAMHYGQMQLTRHLWEAAHPETASTYVHWR